MGALDLMATTDLVGGGDCVTRFGGGEHRATQWGKGVVANCLKMGRRGGFWGEGMTHLEKMEVRLESGDRNLSPCVLEDGLKGFASVGIGQKGWLGHKMTE